MFELDLGERISPLLKPHPDPAAAAVGLRQLAEDSSIGGAELLAALAAGVQKHCDPAVVGTLLRVAHTKCLAAGLVADDPNALAIDPDTIVTLLGRLPAESTNVHLLQQLLATAGTTASITALLDSLQTQPPRGWMAAGQVLSPLMQRTGWPVDALFPAALALIANPAIAAPILDLAGHLTRTGQVARHPAADRVAALNHLLGSVIGRLEKLESDPTSFGSEVEAVQAILGEAMALAVSLCDALGLIGSDTSVPKLQAAAEIRHRRVQTEAAGALARMGHDRGHAQIVALASEPISRRRAIAYATELGFEDQITDADQSEEALAEADMALWLSQPQAMGVPPTSVSVVDRRRMLWPGDEDPVDVFLVRFDYALGSRQYSNVGFTGPGTHAFGTDVADLPVDDIYAMYAGWHADHPEIRSHLADKLSEPQTRVMGELAVWLDRQGHENCQPELLCQFLDETAGVFSATRDGKECLVITDGLETMDLPTGGRWRAPTPEDLFNLYKGRKMLRSFNVGQDLS